MKGRLLSIALTLALATVSIFPDTIKFYNAETDTEFDAKEMGLSPFTWSHVIYDQLNLLLEECNKGNVTYSACFNGYKDIFQAYLSFLDTISNNIKILIGTLLTHKDAEVFNNALTGDRSTQYLSSILNENVDLEIQYKKALQWELSIAKYFVDNLETVNRIIPMKIVIRNEKTEANDKIDISDYFPSDVGASWTYANSSGINTNIIIVKNSMPDKNDGTNLYLFENQILGLGTTSTLYSIKDNNVVILVTKNALGKYQENQKPYPIALAPVGQQWRYDDRGDDLRYTTSRTSCSYDGKTYNDCILVEEKIISGNSILRIKKSYYAKGIGLVYVTLQDGGGKESIFMKLVGSTF
jgi:hypothetical protein